jgi:hypothetical protein
VVSLEQVNEEPPPPWKRASLEPPRSSDDRDVLVAQARERNAQAFAPWTKEEEQDIKKRHAAGESISMIARTHKRSPRAIELRLQRLGVLPRDQ